MQFSYLITMLAATTAALPAAHIAKERRDASIEVSNLKTAREVAATVNLMNKDKRQELSSLISREPMPLAIVEFTPMDNKMTKRTIISDIGTEVKDLETLVNDLVKGALNVTVTFVKDLDTVVADLETLVGDLLKDVLSGVLAVSITIVDDLETAVTNLENIVADIDTFVDKTLTPDLFNALNAALSELQTLVGEL